MLRVLALMALGTVLAILVVRHSGGSYLSRASAEAATRYRIADSGALVVAAERHIASGLAVPTRGASQAEVVKHLELRRARLRDEASIEDLARNAVLANPLNPQALRLLGEISEARSAGQGTSPSVVYDFMHAAARISGREAVAVEWMFRFAMKRKDYGTAMQFADKLLRAYPDIVAPFAPSLAVILDDKAVGEDLVALLGRNPPWREHFVLGLMPAIADARAPLHLFLRLKATAHPPTTTELRSYMLFLAHHKRFELAYYTWLQFLPSDQLKRAGFLFNGSFESDPSGLPFDWSISHGRGVNVEFVRAAPGDVTRHLRVAFGEGRAELHGIAQVVLLSAGRYRFKSQFKGNMVGRRGLEWRVQCAEEPNNLGRRAIPLGSTRFWTSVDLEFIVPETGCRAQRVHLVLDARSASDQLVQGELWFKSLEIVRSGS